MSQVTIVQLFKVNFSPLVLENVEVGVKTQIKMDKRPSFLGRGRGRGRGVEENGAKSRQRSGRFAGNLQSQVKLHSGRGIITAGKSAETCEVSKERMKKAEEIKEAAKRYMEKAEDEFEDSSEDEEINDDEILNNTLKNYRHSSQGIDTF